MKVRINVPCCTLKANSHYDMQNQQSQGSVVINSFYCGHLEWAELEQTSFKTAVSIIKAGEIIMTVSTLER